MGEVIAEIDAELLTSQLDYVCATDLPSENIAAICAWEQEHLADMSKSHGRFIDQFHAYYDLLVHMIGQANKALSSDWPQHRVVQLIMVTRNLKPIYSSFDRLTKGFYEDSFVLSRTAYEAFWRVIFISCNPDDEHHSFAPKTKGLKQFQLTNFVEQDLKLNWRHYSIFSAMTHANQFSVLKDMVKIGREKGISSPIVLTFERDELLLGLAVNFIKFLLYAYLKTTITLFLTDKTNVDPQLMSKCDKYIELRMQCFMSHPDEHWRKVVKDMEDICHMLKEVEDGAYWTDVWRRLRQQNTDKVE